MNRIPKSHNDLLKSLLLISKIKLSDVDEVEKFGKTPQSRNKKINRIQDLYNQEDENLDDIVNPAFPLQSNFLDDLDPDTINKLFLSDQEYANLADMISEAMDEIEREELNKKNIDNQSGNGEFKIFKKEPSFDDLVEWFRVLLLANNGELQLTLTPGNELIIIFKNYVTPNGARKNDGSIDQKTKRKRTTRRKKNPPPEQDNE